jgi:hypothetical protein
LKNKIFLKNVLRLPHYEHEKETKNSEQNYTSDYLKTELPSLLTVCFYGKSLFIEVVLSHIKHPSAQ